MAESAQNSLRQRLDRLVIVVILFSFLAWPALAWAAGWYLMMPPLLEKSGWEPFRGGLSRWEPDPAVPLSKWEIHSSYDTARECEEGRIGAVRLAEDILKREKDQSQKLGMAPETSRTYRVGDGYRKALDYAKCLATDDPRLK